MFNSTPGLYPPGASSPSPKVWQPEMPQALPNVRWWQNHYSHHPTPVFQNSQVKLILTWEDIKGLFQLSKSTMWRKNYKKKKEEDAEQKETLSLKRKERTFWVKVKAKWRSEVDKVGKCVLLRHNNSQDYSEPGSEQNNVHAWSHLVFTWFSVETLYAPILQMRNWGSETLANVSDSRS